MARLPDLKREALDADSQAVWDRVAGSRGSVRGPMALLMHNSPLADRVAELGARLRFQGTLSGADRELAILTAGREVEATYEWAAHEPLGRDEGVSSEAIEVLRTRGRPTASASARRSSSTPSGPFTASTSSRTRRTPGPKQRSGSLDWSRSWCWPATTACIGYVLNVFEAELPDGATPAFAR